MPLSLLWEERKKREIPHHESPSSLRSSKRKDELDPIVPNQWRGKERGNAAKEREKDADVSTVPGKKERLSRTENCQKRVRC